MKEIVVIGGGYAGVLAALRLAGRARRAGIPAAVKLIDGGSTFVERVRLHEVAVGKGPRRIDLTRLLRRSGVELVVGWARRIDPVAGTIEVQAGPARDQTFAFDRLVLAAGSRVADEPLPGTREYGFTLGDGGARKLARRLASMEAGERVVVVGGGLTAIEAASEIAERYAHLEVVLACEGRLGADLSEAGRAYVFRAFDELGVRVREQTRGVEIQPDGLVVKVGGIQAGVRLPAGAVVVAAGFRAAPLAASSGLPTDGAGRVIVDDHLQVVGHPAIWAAGDAAAARGADGRPLRMACATAMPQAAFVADDVIAALRGTARPPFRFGYLVRCVSLGRRRGLVQWVDEDDVPRDAVLTGRLGAWFKEAVVRFTVFALRLERLIPGAYRWPQPAPDGGRPALTQREAP